MNEHTYRISEIVGSSTTGTDDAVKNAVEKAAKTLHGLEWFEVTHVRGHLQDGAVAHYQVTVKVGFRLDD